MALQLQGNGGVIAEVDGSTFRTLRTVGKPMEYGAFGAYQAAMTSATLSAVLVSNAVLFSFRWGDATRLCVVTYIKLSFQTLTLFTAAQQVDFGFDAYAARAFSASHTGGTAATLTTNSFKTRTSMGTTLLTDMRICAAGASGLSAGTLVLDGNAFAASIGDPQRMNPAAATEEQRVNDPTLEWKPDIACGEAPLVLAQNEGFVLRNRTLWPAAGTGIVQVHVRWTELAAY